MFSEIKIFINTWVSGWHTKLCLAGADNGVLGAKVTSLHPSTYPSFYRDQTIAQIAREKATARPDEIAFYFDDDSSITFGDIYDEGVTLAASLSSLGCQKGDVVSFQLPNWREAIALDIAAAMLGLVINPIIPIYRDREVGFILKDTAAKVFLIPQSFRRFDFTDMVGRLKPELPNLDHVIVVGGEASRDDEFLSYQALLENAKGSQVALADVDPDSVKMLLYTSGTTGNPKAVRHSHNTFARAFDNGAEAWSLGEGDVMLMPSPVTHITGFANGVELPFLSNAKTAFMEVWDVSVAIEYIKKVGATTCLSATPFLQELVNTCAASGETLPTMRFFACGGASVPPSLIYQTHKVLAHCRAFRVYGSTEVPLVTVGFIVPGQEKQAAETDGRIHNYEVQVENDDGQVLGINEDGEILVRGPAMMLGYGDDEQTTGALSVEGFFHTGDIGHVTPEGAIVITDRKKDIIIRGGENLSAREIEEVILQHEGISQAAAVAMPHERLGEGVCVFLVLNEPGVSLSLDALKPFLVDSGLARQKWPERIEIRDSLPMTASGKIRKDVLRNELKSLAAAS